VLVPGLAAEDWYRCARNPKVQQLLRQARGPEQVHQHRGRKIARTLFVRFRMLRGCYDWHGGLRLPRRLPHADRGPQSRVISSSHRASCCLNLNDCDATHAPAETLRTVRHRLKRRKAHVIDLEHADVQSCCKRVRLCLSVLVPSVHQAETPRRSGEVADAGRLECKPWLASCIS
jgi:hypothetical protein